ncbi:hypothetical protein GWI33_000697 [Rhynchophorus ferrugineus]|uniref:Uncharacterized protein n=1 Tax=Rhynchophorus ferrugineus TaxID=354439 RepID=A0A834M1F1_RHYFE|nr:hypothetical protein GWI33_000729 [Rhynchophorus ferrugineus]KAF7264061.1 hypothetical protein GWI33_000697 [Rhynchophorus ferrugineus]
MHRYSQRPVPSRTAVPWRHRPGSDRGYRSRENSPTTPRHRSLVRTVILQRACRSVLLLPPPLTTPCSKPYWIRRFLPCSVRKLDLLPKSDRYFCWKIYVALLVIVALEKIM